MFRSLIFATVSAVALCGAAHADVSISNKPTQNMSCDSGVCTATAQKAVLNVGDLQTMLASGDVAVKTGSVTDDIVIAQPLTWSSLNRLTLDAQRSVVVKKPVTVAGTGALTITTNDGGSGGDLYFFANGTATFANLSSSLIINGIGYALAGDVKTLADYVTHNPAGYFALAIDYNASADGTYSGAPVQTSFPGTFNGLGHAIAALKVTATADQIAYPALFSHADSGAIIRNINLRDVNVSGTAHFGAAIVGWNEGSIINSSATGSISLTGELSTSGGLVGALVYPGSITASLSNCVIKGTYSSGGLAGYSSGSIVASQSSGHVSGGLSVGGLVGFSAGVIERSSAAGMVSKGSDAGGLVGLNIGIIDQSFATGPVQADRGRVGGLVGRLQHNHAVIRNSYATGAVSGDRAGTAGSLIGRSLGYKRSPPLVQFAYAAGQVSVGSSKYSGGVVGEDRVPAGGFSDAYWDLDTTGINDPSHGAGNIPNDPGMKGLTDAELKSGLPEGFDPKIWGSNPNINNGYPYLLANPPR